MYINIHQFTGYYKKNIFLKEEKRCGTAKVCYFY